MEEHDNEKKYTAIEWLVVVSMLFIGIQTAIRFLEAIINEWSLKDIIGGIGLVIILLYGNQTKK